MKGNDQLVTLFFVHFVNQRVEDDIPAVVYQQYKRVVPDLRDVGLMETWKSWAWGMKPGPRSLQIVEPFITNSNLSWDQRKERRSLIRISVVVVSHQIKGSWIKLHSRRPLSLFLLQEINLILSAFSRFSLFMIQQWMPSYLATKLQNKSTLKLSILWF